MNNPALETLTLHSLNDYLTIASNYFDMPFYFDEVCFDLRGRSAGQFVVSKPNIFAKHVLKLRFNRFLLAKYQQAFVDEVVPHECAHLVVYQYFGQYHQGKKVKPHGMEWKHVMSNVFNKAAVVRHNFEVDTKPRETFIYQCECVDRDHALSLIRHNKVMRQKAIYLCKACKSALRIKKGWS